VASTHSYVFFFSDKGKVYVKKVFEIPEGARNAKGRAIVNFVGMEPGEKVCAITPVPAVFDDNTFVVTLTRRGQIKKTMLSEYENYREKGIIGVKIEEADQLLSAAITDGTQELVIATRGGMSIRFSETDVRPTGRATMGVKGIDLDEADGGDVVVGLVVATAERDRVLAVCERGYGKQTPLEEFRKQSRGGKGVILIDASDRNGPVVGIAMVGPTDEVMLVTDRGQMIRTRASEIRETGRNAQGVRLMNVDEGERVVAIEAFAVVDVPEGGSSNPPLDGEADVNGVNGAATASTDDTGVDGATAGDDGASNS
jgi:DNA gyrase subunit A